MRGAGDLYSKNIILFDSAKSTPKRRFLTPLCNDLIGIGSGEAISLFLHQIGLESYLSIFERGLRDNEDYKLSLIDLRITLKSIHEELFQERISPVICYIGATGLLPDEWSDLARFDMTDLSQSSDNGHRLRFPIGDDTFIHVKSINRLSHVHRAAS